MNHKLMERLKQKGKKLNPLEQKAKMGVIKELSDQAGSMMGDKVKALKKVSVASDSKEGLEHGLDKAKELIESPASSDPEKEMAGGILGMSKDHPNDHNSPGGKSAMEQAEELMHEDLDNDGEEGESSEHQDAVLGEHAPDDDGEMTHEEIDAKMKELMHKKSKLAPKHHR